MSLYKLQLNKRHIGFNHSLSIPYMREEIKIDVANNNPGNSIEEHYFSDY